MNAAIDRRRLGQGLDWPCDGSPFPGEALVMAAWSFSITPTHPVAEAYQLTLPERQKYRWGVLWQAARQMRKHKIPARAFRAYCLASVLEALREVRTEEELFGLAELLGTPVEVLSRWVAGFGDTPAREVLRRMLLRSPDTMDICAAELLTWSRGWQAAS